MYTSNYLAILFLKYMLEEGKTSPSKGEEIIASLTDDPFLRNFIPLATYWSNDLIDVCFHQLGIEQPEETPSFNIDTHDQWYAWFEETINKEWQERRPARIWNDVEKTWDISV